MSYTPHLRRGGELYHWRPKGSRNGYSNDPNYKPVGQKAQGQLVNGRYVYDNKVGGAGRNMGMTRPVTLAKPQKKQNIFQRAASGAKSAGNWLADRGGKAVNTVGRAASSAGQAIGKGVSRAAKDTSKWVGDRASDVGKAASSAGKAVSKAAGDVGKAANSVKEWATGGRSEHEKGVQKGKKASEEFRYGSGNPFVGYADTHKGKKDANEIIKNGGWDKNDINKDIQDARKEQRKLRGESNKHLEKYDKSLAGQIDKLKYGKNVYDAVKQHGDKWINKPKNIKEMITGENYKKSSDERKRIANDYNELANRVRTEKDSKGNLMFARSEGWQREGREYDREADRLNKQADLLNELYERAPRQRLNKAGKDISKAASDAKSFVEKTATNAGKSISKAASDVGKGASKLASDAGKTASKVASDVGKGASKAAGDAKEFVEKTASSAGKSISKAASDVGKGASKLASDAGKTASKAAGDAKEFVSNLLGGKKNEKKEASKHNKPIKTNSIETKPIETKPIETKSTPTKKSSNSTKSEPYMSDEYKEELEYNSRKNSFGNSNNSSSTTSKSKSKPTSSKKSSNSNPKVSKEYEEEMAYNSQKNNNYGFDADKINSIDGGKGYFTYDKNKGETVYVDKNGKKHYK